MVWRRSFLLAATVMTLLLTWVDDNSGSLPTQKWVTVQEVSAEYSYVQGKPCRCGGTFHVEHQSSGVVNNRRYDRLDCKCQKCGNRVPFFFDVTSIFEEAALSNSEAAKAKTYARLDQRFPSLAPELLPTLTKLLNDRNPNVRSWAMEKIAKLNTPDARECLICGYLNSGLLGSFEFLPALTSLEADLLPQVEERFKNPERMGNFRLIDVLDRIKLPQSARLIEQQLRHEMTRTDGEQRHCYISLGLLGFKDSEPLLLEAFEREKANPDDSLLWALGRCGTEKSLPVVRQAAQSPAPDVKASAIVALGLLGDQSAIPGLIKLIEAGDQGDLESNHDIVHNAICALGLLRANAAIPLLIQYLKGDPHRENHMSATGMYDSNDLDAVNSGGVYINVSIHALQRMGVREALADFRRILGDDEYYLSYDDVSNAAAEIGLHELVPDIIARFEKEGWLEAYGKRIERFSPSLRKLTGQSFGEDPKKWQEWLTQQVSINGIAR